MRRPPFFGFCCPDLDHRAGRPRVVGPRLTISARLRLALLDDRRVALADFNYGPLLVNFWATSYGPCVRELPALTA